MNALPSIVQNLVNSWQRTGPTGRLLVGVLIIALVTLAGLTPKYVFGMELVFPYMGLIAAIGWGRAGFALAPMIFLLIFGFADDVSQAPWGSHGLANLLTYGFAASLFQTFDIERNPLMNIGLPFVCTLVGIVLIWTLASVSLGQPARAAPLVSAFIATIFVQSFAAPLFDLGIRHGLSGGRTR